MAKKHILILIIVLLILSVDFTYGQTNNLGLGVELDFNESIGAGLSIKYKINSKYAIQGIISFSGKESKLHSHFEYKFFNRKEYNFFLFGGLGLNFYDGHSKLFIKGGAGIEFNFYFENYPSFSPYLSSGFSIYNDALYLNVYLGINFWLF